VENKDQQSVVGYSVGDAMGASQPIFPAVSAPNDVDALSQARVDSLAQSQILHADTRPRDRFRIFRRADVALVVLLFLGLTGLIVNTVTKKQPITSQQASISDTYDTVQLPLEGFVVTEQGVSFGASTVSINGALQLNDGLTVKPGLQPADATAGQLYYDQNTNLLAYYNGSQFVPLGAEASAPDTVESLGGASGALGLGGGLTIVGDQIVNSGVLSVGGQTGAVAIGNGLVMAGGTLQNGGVVSIASSSPTLSVATDANGNVTLTSSPAGTGTVTSGGGTTGLVPLFTGAQNVEDSLISQSGTTITISGDLDVTSDLTLGSALTVVNGGTGATTLTANGVIVGNGAGALTSVAAGGAGLCLLSTAGAPTFSACPSAGGVTTLNGLSGAVSIANVTATGSTITIDNATNAAKGIASFNATNFSVTSGAVNTVQNINTSATPTFAGVNTNSITPSAALTLGVSAQTALLQGSTTTITSSGVGNDIVLNSADTIELQDNTNVTGNVATSGDVAVNGGDITASGALTITPGGTLTAGVSGQTLTLQGNASTSLRATNAGSTTIVGFTNPTANTTINFPALSAGTYTVCTTANNCTGVAATLQSAYDNSTSPEIVVDATRAAVTIRDASSAIGGNLLEVQNNSGATTYLAVTASGLVVTGTASVSATINSITGGIQTNSTTRIDNAGNLTNIAALAMSGAISGATTITASGNINSTGGALQTNNTTRIDNSGNLTNIAALTLSGAISGGTTYSGSGNINTTGGVLQTNSVTRVDNSGNLTNIAALTLSGSISGGTNFSGSGTINTTGGVIQTNSTTRIDNSGNLTNIAAITASGNATLQGGSITLGTNAQAGSVVISDGSSNMGTIQTLALGQNTVYRLPDPGTTTADICLTTGNCSGVGGGVTGSGTNNRLSKFTSTGSTLGDSTITDNGTLVSTSADLTIQGGDVTIGVATSQTGTLNFAHSSSSFLGSITQNSLSANRTYNLPDAGGDFCLSSGNCLGGGAGGANTALSNLSGVAINTSLLPGTTTIDLGSGSAAFRNLYLAGSSSSPATNNFAITGAATAARTIILPDADGAVCLQSSASCGFAPTSGSGNYIQNQIATDQSADFRLSGNGRAVTFSATTSINTGAGAGTQRIDASGNLTNIVALTLSGAISGGTTYSGSGNINTTGGVLQTNSVTRVDNSGNLTNIAALTLSGSISGGTTYGGSGNINTTGGAVQTNSTTRIDNSGNLTNIAALTMSGAISGATTITGSGNINTTGGALQTNGTTRVDNSGNLTNIGNLTASGAITIASVGAGNDIIINGADILDVQDAATFASTLGVNGTTTLSGDLAANGPNATLGDSSSDLLTINAVIQGGSPLVFEGGSADASELTITIASLSGDQVITLPDASGQVCLSIGNCAGAGSTSTLQAAYDAGNTIATTSARDVAITLADSVTDGNFTITTATNATGFTTISRADGAGTADPSQLLLVDNLDVNRTQPVGIKLQAAFGLTTAIDASDAEIGDALNVGANNIVGTAAVIDFTNFDVSSAGAVTAVGVNAGSGLLQGTGGITVTGTAGLNTTGTANTSIGNATGTFALASSGLNVTTAGALSGITTITSSGAINSQTISSTANFTGTVTIQGSNALTLGVTGTSTGALLFKGATAASGTLTLNGPANPSNNTLTLPNETGVVCSTGSVCTGYAPTNGTTGTGYIWNTTTQQTANMNILSGGSSGVATARIEQVANSSAGGYGLFVQGGSNPGENAFQVNNTSSAQVFGVDTAATRVIVGSTCSSGRLCVGQTTSSGTGNTVQNLYNQQTISGSAGTNTYIGQNIVVTDTTASAASTINPLRIDTSSTTNTSATINSIYAHTPSGANGTFLQLQNGSTDVLAIGNNGVTTFRGQSSSATAFQIQDTAAASLFTIDTTARSGSGGNLVKIGNSTGTDTAITILQLDATTADPTSNLSALNGGLFYNSTTNKVSLIENGAVKIICNTTDLGCGTGTVTLQSAYNNGNSITTTDNRSISFAMADTTTDPNFLIDLQCDTSCGSNGRFSIQDDGTDVFTVSPAGGAATFQNQTDSTTGFRVLNSSAVPQFVLDTSNSRVYVGNPSADSTGALLVLDTKNTSGDPTGVNGAMYYNSSSNKMRCYENSFWRDCINTPRTDFYAWTDFMGAGGDSYFVYGTNAAAGTSVNTGAVTSVAGHPGIVQFDAGTTTTGRVSLMSGHEQGILLGGNDIWRFESVLRVPTLSNGTDTFTVRSGFMDNNDVESTDGCFFRYTNGTNGGKWQGVCRASGSENTCDTTIAVGANTWYRLNIAVNAAGTSVDFATDGTSRCQVTATIPTGAGEGTGYGTHIKKSAGTTSRVIDMDYVEVIGQLNTPR
jgi:hypothetical protein